MGLSTELISEFVKITNDNKKGKEDNTVYGTVATVSKNGKYGTVKIDGSDEATPVSTTCSMSVGDRVRLTVRNHNAIVTGNVSDQSIGVKRAGSIEASIKNLGDTLEFQVSDKKGSLASKITMVSNRIDSEVLDTTNGNSLASKVSQMPNQIESSVKATYIDPINTAIGGEGGLNARLSNAESSIKQMPDQIVSKVASTYITNEGGINSKITDFSEFKQTVEGFSFMGKGGTVKITGGQIDATGLKLQGEGAEININDVFKVSSTGVVTWAASNSPTKAQYSKNGTSDWHDTYASTDYYARYSYDGGTTWTSAILIQGKNGTNGKDGNDGEDGADAEIPDGWAKTVNGTTYIDGEMIYSDSIYADSIHLGGRLAVYQTESGDTLGGRFGYTSGFNSEYGIGMWADDTYDRTDKCYIPIEGQCICTDQAARLSYSNIASVVASSDGNITLNASGSVYLETDGYVVARTYYDGKSDMFIPGDDDTVYLGKSSHYWAAAYATNYYGSVATATGSDRNLKNSIENLPDKYIKMFDRLKPVRYKLNKGTSGRYHIGYIAQDVEEAMAEVGIDSQEFGGIVKDKNEDGSYTYMLRYGEFDAIYAAKLKQLEARVAALEER